MAWLLSLEQLVLQVRMGIRLLAQESMVLQPLVQRPLVQSMGSCLGFGMGLGMGLGLALELLA